MRYQVISNDFNNWGGCDQVKDYLELNKVYEVERIEVNNWHTKVFLKDFPGKRFNSVHFRRFD